MLKLLIMLVTVLALTPGIKAQKTDKKEQIKGLFAVMHQDSLVMKSIDAMTSSAVKSMAAMFNDTLYSNHGINVAAYSGKLMVKSMQRSKELALKLVNEDMVDIYDRYFTVKEINDFSRFYQSTSGKKMLEKMPDIMKDLMDVMTTKYQKDLQESIMKDIQDMMSEMKMEVDKSINSKKSRTAASL